MIYQFEKTTSRSFNFQHRLLYNVNVKILTRLLTYSKGEAGDFFKKIEKLLSEGVQNAPPGLNKLRIFFAVLFFSLNEKQTMGS